VRTDYEQFIEFFRLLMFSASPDYVPWLFRCGRGSKVPELSFGSWSAERTRVTEEEAVAWLKTGGNIGIAGMKDDPLVNVDIDDETVTDIDLMLPTLMARSSSRIGVHAYYFSNDEKIINIPTQGYGEVRTKNQYVIAPGSFVPLNEEKMAAVPESERENAGRYTIENAKPAAWIEYQELPEIFIGVREKEKAMDESIPRSSGFDPKESEGRHSAVFDVTARDIVAFLGGSTNPKDRWDSPFHGSKSKAVTSFSNGLIQCWGCCVTLNGFQTLVALSGYMTDKEAGAGFYGDNRSQVIGDDGAIFHAWLYAKKNGIIAEDDPIPVKAMKYVAREHGVEYEPDQRGMMPRRAYNRILEIVGGL